MTVSVTEAVATTIRKHRGELADNVSANIPLLMRLRKIGRAKQLDGGTEILEELDYAENESFVWYHGFQRLQVVLDEVLTAALFAWKQAGAAVAISGRLRMMNRGSERQVDAIVGKVKNAERTVMNNLNAAVFADGTADNGRQLGGLQLLVSTSPTSGTVGGIDRALNEWWRNYALDEPSTVDNIVDQCEKVMRATTRGNDGTDLICMDDNLYGLLQSALRKQQRFRTRDSDMAQAGFETMAVGRADAVHCGGVGGHCPADRAFFLNTDYLMLRTHMERDLEPQEAGRPIDLDADVTWLWWMGALCMSNARLQGVLDGAA